MNFSLGCSLVYRVKSPTPFVFNFEAARFDVQTVREERLELIPKTSIERWTMPGVATATCASSQNRANSASVTRRRWSCRRAWKIRMRSPRSPPDSPFEVLTHLYPSRYCQSDKLVRFAGRTFRDLPSGYHRVNGVCNWIRDNVDYALGSS